MTNAENIVPQWTQSDRLVKARHVAGLNQKELADRLDISERTVKRYEAGEAPTKRTVVVAWALACGVSVRWLATGQEGGTVTEADTLWKLSPDQLALKFAA